MFSKGQSGNPGGGNATAELRKATKQEAEKSLNVLAEIRDNDAMPITARMDAASRILAAAVNKPVIEAR